MSSIQVVSNPIQTITNPVVIAPSDSVIHKVDGKGFFPRVQLVSDHPEVTAFSFETALVSAILPDNKLTLLLDDTTKKNISLLGEDLRKAIQEWYPDVKIWWHNDPSQFKRHKDCTLPLDQLAGKEITDVVARVGLIVTPAVAKDGNPETDPIQIVFVRTFYQLLSWTPPTATQGRGASSSKGRGMSSHPRQRA